MTERKRLVKYSTKSLKKFSKINPFIVYTIRKRSTKEAKTLITTILRDFFFLQYKQKLHITKIPIIHVDTPLDDKIPFTPSEVKIYMTFIDLMAKSLDFLYKRIGYEKCLEQAKSLMEFLGGLYKNASSIYRFSMTTTHRPKYFKGPFFLIHLTDPHYLCVPSLHVAIAAGVYSWYRKNLSSTTLPKEEVDWRLEEVRNWAIKIVESVLFVKQHSINCIPAALYMITATMGDDFFSPSDAYNFINMLFAETDLISDEDKKSLNNHFHFIYEKFLLENKYTDRWQEPVERWLSELRDKSTEENN